MADFVGRGGFEESIAQFMAREMARIKRQVESDLLAAGMDVNRTQIFSQEYWSGLSANIETLMRGKLEDVYMDAAEQFMDTVNYAMDNDLLRASARAWANQASMNLVTQMNDTSRRQVLDSVDNFFNESMSNKELRERLERVFSPRRAELAAVTEVTRAASEGSERVAADLRSKGVRLVAVWQTLVDERVCPICGPRHEQKQGDGWMFLPPAHPKCRCYVNYEVLDLSESATKSFPMIYIGQIICIEVAA
jgi:hypothetical protein